MEPASFAELMGTLWSVVVEWWPVLIWVGIALWWFTRTKTERIEW